MSYPCNYICHACSCLSFLVQNTQKGGDFDIQDVSAIMRRGTTIHSQCKEIGCDMASAAAIPSFETLSRRTNAFSDGPTHGAVDLTHIPVSVRANDGTLYRTQVYPKVKAGVEEFVSYERLQTSGTADTLRKLLHDQSTFFLVINQRHIIAIAAIEQKICWFDPKAPAISGMHHLEGRPTINETAAVDNLIAYIFELAEVLHGRANITTLILPICLARYSSPSEKHTEDKIILNGGATFDNGIQWNTSLLGLKGPYHVDLVSHHRFHLESQAQITGNRSLTSLVNALQEKTFSYDDEDTLARESSVHSLIAMLTKRINDTIEPTIFHGMDCQKVGSFWDRTRVSSEADEFDTMVTIPPDKVDATLKSDTGNWCVCLKANIAPLVPLVCGVRNENTRLVDPDIFYRQFEGHIDAFLATSSLPDGLRHSGLLSPMYRRVTDNQPALTLYLTWRTKHRISVDVCPAIPLPWKALPPGVRRRLDRLTRLAQMRRPPSHPAHLVPCHGTWILTTSVIEASALQHMGRQSACVSDIRALKLITYNFLHWAPTNAMTSHARQILDNLIIDQDDTVSVEHGTRRDTVIDANLTGVGAIVRTSLENNDVLFPDADLSKGHDGKRCVAIWLIHRLHGHDTTPGHCPRDCSLCTSLIRHARGINLSLINPVFCEIVGEAMKAWATMRSAYLKYIVLESYLEETPHPTTTCHERHPSECQIRVMGYLRRLSKQATDKEGVRHPLLGLFAEPIEPVIWRAGDLRAWHAEQARQLCSLLELLAHNEGPIR